MRRHRDLAPRRRAEVELACVGPSLENEPIMLLLFQPSPFLLSWRPWGPQQPKNGDGEPGTERAVCQPRACRQTWFSLVRIPEQQRTLKRGPSVGREGHRLRPAAAAAIRGRASSIQRPRPPQRAPAATDPNPHSPSTPPSPRGLSTSPTITENHTQTQPRRTLPSFLPDGHSLPQCGGPSSAPQAGRRGRAWAASSLRPAHHSSCRPPPPPSAQARGRLGKRSMATFASFSSDPPRQSTSAMN